MINKPVYVKVSAACAELGVSEIQLMDWIENHQLRAAVYCPQVKGILAYGKRRGAAMATFEGFCRLKYGDIRRLIIDEKVKVTWFRPDDWRFVTIDSYQYSLKAPLPNILFDTWLGAVDMSIYAPDFLFYPLPSNTLDIQKVKTGITPEKISEIFKKTPKDFDFEEFASLSASTHSFTLDQLRVWLPDLARLKNEVSAPKIEAEKPSNEVALRPIDKLICHIFKLHPNYKDSEVWKLLIQDVLKTERIYDKDEILDEVGTKELYWYNLSGELCSLKKQSFYTLVERLKLKGIIYKDK
jgi:hypothetical protein